MTRGFKDWFIGLTATVIMSLIMYGICKIPLFHIDLSLLESWGLIMIAIAITAGRDAYYAIEEDEND